MNLGVIPKLPKLPKLPKFSNLPNASNAPKSICAVTSVRAPLIVNYQLSILNYTAILSHFFRHKMSFLAENLRNFAKNWFGRRFAVLKGVNKTRQN